MEALHIGCSGWDYDDWDDVVYEPGLPRKRRLDAYAQEFETVEVNSSFYRLPARDTVAEWVERVPDGFLFAFKASRYLTHIKRLDGIGHGIRRLLGRLRPAAEAGKLGPVLWQLPPNFEAAPQRLARVLELLPEGRHAFEFRHESWFRDDVFQLLQDAGAALVVADDSRTTLPAPPPVGDWAYVRLHYGARGRRGNYSKRELEAWKRRLAGWRREREVFVYLNNDWEGFAPRNAQALMPN
jgi:uncharacterized protein YecE (DUF72 family)